MECSHKTGSEFQPNVNILNAKVILSPLYRLAGYFDIFILTHDLSFIESCSFQKKHGDVSEVKLLDKACEAGMDYGKSQVF